MRVLTKHERDLFDTAYKHISSLSAMQNDFTELFMLRHGLDGALPIPPAYFTLSEAIGGFAVMRERFSLMYRERATEWLIKYCFKHAIQPSAFEIVGAIRKINVERKNYTQHTYQSG